MFRALAFALITATAVSAQTVIFDDDFSDNDRSNQSLPGSLAWFQNTDTPVTPGRLAVTDGALQLDAANLTRLVWGYFPAVDLGVGEALILALEVNFTTPPEAIPRFALFNSNGMAPQRADGPALTGAYQGYMHATNNLVSLAPFKRDGPGAAAADATLLTSIGPAQDPIWRQWAPAAAVSFPAGSVPYIYVLRLARTATDALEVTASFIGNGQTVTAAAVDRGAIFTRFDLIAIGTNTSMVEGSMRIDRASLVRTTTSASAAVRPTRSVRAGNSTSIGVIVPTSIRPTFQWQRKAAGSDSWVNLSANATYLGVTSSQLTVRDAILAMNGDQLRAVMRSTLGETAFDPWTLQIASARLTNLSVLTSLPASGDTFTLGYVVGGRGTSGPKSLLIRAAGPSLTPLGVSGVLDDPKLETFAGASKTGENDNWGGQAEVAGAMAGVGAFAFTAPNSRDAAVLASISSADNSVRVSAVGAGTGTVIAEVYDATPGASFGTTTPRLINVSALKHLGTGLTAGFVVGGSGATNILVRAVGPTLAAAPFNVPGVIADPQLVLFRGSTRVGENDDWKGNPAIAGAMTAVGAFALPANSLDAAVLANLEPGNYTVQVSGFAGTTGVALIEVYEVP